MYALLVCTCADQEADPDDYDAFITCSSTTTPFTTLVKLTDMERVKSVEDEHQQQHQCLSSVLTCGSVLRLTRNGYVSKVFGRDESLIGSRTLGEFQHDYLYWPLLANQHTASIELDKHIILSDIVGYCLLLTFMANKRIRNDIAELVIWNDSESCKREL